MIDVMPAPSKQDIGSNGESAEDIFRGLKASDGGSNWCFATLEDLRANIASTGLSLERVDFLKGMVEQIIYPSTGKKSILRLDAG